jgi:hypothetical protein
MAAPRPVLQLTEQVFSSLAPLSVTTLMDLWSGEMTQVACAAVNWQTKVVAAKAARKSREFMEPPPNAATMPL